MLLSFRPLYVDPFENVFHDFKLFEVAWHLYLSDPILNILHHSGVNDVVLHCIASSSFTFYQIISPFNVLLACDLLKPA